MYDGKVQLVFLISWYHTLHQNVLCVKAFVLRLLLLWSSGGKDWWQIFGQWRYVIEGDSGTTILLHLFHMSAMGGWLCSPTASVMTGHHFTHPRHRASSCCAKVSKTVSGNKSFLCISCRYFTTFLWLLQVFYYNGRKLTNTLSKQSLRMVGHAGLIAWDSVKPHERNSVLTAISLLTFFEPYD